MNNLQLTNDNFNSNALSKYQYTISLINECVRSEILPKTFLYNVQIKISEILKDLIMRYTKGQSSSVTVEKAEKLIIGIWYTIDAYMKKIESPEESIKTLREEEISYIYERGKNILKEDFIDAKDLYEKVLRNRISTDLTSYNDTLSGIENFFKYYDLEFEPDENTADIDYPLAFDDWDVVGLYYIKNYLENLYIENQICNKFYSKDIHKILKSYGENYKIDYRDLLINIFEMTINNAVFSILCNNNSLEINEEEFGKINDKIERMNEEEVKTLISLSINKIINDYELLEYEKNYLENYKKNLIDETLNALKRDSLSNFIVINKENKSNPINMVIDEEYRMEDEEFRELIEEIISSDNIYEKIDLINKNINSIKDYIDMLKSDCLFEEEYILLYMSLSNIELSFLGKYVFYGEYRMEDLQLDKYLNKKINTTSQWEEFYIEYLKSLDKSNLKEIEDLINGKL
ncbi:DUF6179 domain-containing protein [Terrisporobacter sp.]